MPRMLSLVSFAPSFHSLSQSHSIYCPDVHCIHIMEFLLLFNAFCHLLLLMLLLRYVT